MNPTRTEYKPITAHVIYRCKGCKKTLRETYTVERYGYCNNHPEWYLRKSASYRRVAGGRWVESHYFRFPAVACPGCDAQLYGKAVEGRFKADHPCDKRCTGATGHSCECSCGGENHGRDHSPIMCAPPDVPVAKCCAPSLFPEVAS